jgi:hypothetical protein
VSCPGLAHISYQPLLLRYRPRTSSSRSTVTPLGPNRLTLPPGQHPPSLSSNRALQEEVAHSHSRPLAQSGSTQRPGSSRFAEYVLSLLTKNAHIFTSYLNDRQYSYMPPSAPQYHPQQLTHMQTAPRRAKQNQNQQPSQAQPRAVVPAARFKPAQGPPVSSNRAAAPGRPSQAPAENQAMHHEARQRNMGPPPTPQQVRQQQPPAQSSARRSNPSRPSSNRFLPPSQRFAPPVLDQQHFMPSTSNGAPQRFVADSGSRGPLAATSSSRAPSRAAMVNISGGGQRVPFVPHALGGFG